MIIVSANNSMAAEGLYLLIGRAATIYYFAHFILIMPILGFKEKTSPLPISISDPVLGSDTKTTNDR